MDTETVAKLQKLGAELADALRAQEADRREMAKVVADRDALQARLNEAMPSGGRESLDETARQLKAAREELVTAKALMRRAEWGSVPAPAEVGPACPWCGALRSRDEGHFESCELAAFLADADVDMGSMEVGAGDGS